MAVGDVGDVGDRYVLSVSISLRPRLPGDAAAVLELWRKAAAEPSHTDDVVGVTRLLEDDADALVVAEHDGHIVGP